MYTQTSISVCTYIRLSVAHRSCGWRRPRKYIYIYKPIPYIYTYPIAPPPQPPTTTQPTKPNQTSPPPHQPQPHQPNHTKPGALHRRPHGVGRPLHPRHPCGPPAGRRRPPPPPLPPQGALGAVIVVVRGGLRRGHGRGSGACVWMVCLVAKARHLPLPNLPPSAQRNQSIHPHPHRRARQQGGAPPPMGPRPTPARGAGWPRACCAACRRARPCPRRCWCRRG